MPDLPISLLNPLAVPLTGDVSAIVNAGSTQKFTNDVLATCFNNNYFLSQDPHFKIIASNFTIQKTGIISTIIGGSANRVSSQYGAIVAGAGNLNDSVYSVIGGGANNLIELGAGSDPQASFLGAGTANAIYFGQDSFIGAGIYNYTSGDYNVLCGGKSNSGNSVSSSIVGGEKNWIQRNADFGFIGGGSGNIIGTNAKYSTIVGGEGHNIIFSNSDHCFIGGGYYNSVVVNCSNGVIVGGSLNQIGQGRNSVVVGGMLNSQVATSNTFIGGGGNNSITTVGYAFIGGGTGNSITAGSDYAFILGHKSTINHRGAAILSDSTLNPKTSQNNDTLALCFSGGTVISGGRLQLDTNCPVASNTTDFGYPGEFFVSGVNLYVCTGKNLWGRTRLLVY